MHYTIYKISNKIDGKIYIGSHKTNDLDDTYMGSGKYLKHAQEKYGIENFTKEILFVYDTPEEMYAKEAELVNEEFISITNTYNIKVGGFGGFDYINGNKKNLYGSNGKLGYGQENLELGRTRIRSIEENTRLSKTLIERYASGEIVPTFLGKTHTEETKKKIGAKNAIHQKGELNSQYGSFWAHNILTLENKKFSKDTTLTNEWSLGKSKV